LADAQSGKTSICKLLLKDISPTNGHIFVDGLEISSITNANLDILYLPRNPLFFERRSALYNVEYPLKIRKVAKAERQARARELAEQFGLPLNVKAAKFSTEQRRTLALARALTVKRKIALFDGFFDGDSIDFEYVEGILKHFDTCVILTSDVKLAMGHTVVLDGGVVVH
ncbi:MAG: ATP-binding cassette domain-containing protein, partial [Clostridiales bacterium]|nr:ATP-binding cassette domain-containing protein [Clostridiales bacterium]